VVVSINGLKVTGVEHAKLVGAVSTGDFGSALRSIFDPKSNTTFRWDRVTSLRGHRVSVFVYQVPIEAGAPVTDSRSKKQIVVSYDGRVFVDTATMEVLRITTHFNLPRGFSMSKAEQVVDYRPVEIAGKNYNLPFHSEVRIEEAALIYLNKIDFKAYRKFEAQSTIRYGAFAEDAAPNQAAVPPSAQPAIAVGQDNAQPQRASAAQSSPASVPTTEQPVERSVPSEVSAGLKPPRSDPSRTGTELPAPHTEAPVSGNGTATAEAIPPIVPEPTQISKVEAPPPPVKVADDSAGEPVHLKVNAELVLVPVVVRDDAGRAVGALTKNDFQLFDKGKQQEITSFSIEERQQPAVEKANSADGKSAPAMAASSRVSQANSVVYLVDDIHIDFGDLGQVRQAAERQIDSMQANDEAAILSTSGLVQQAFTSDKAKLHAALNKVHSSPLGDRKESGCPKVSYYQADQILNVYAQTPASSPPLKIAYDEAILCLGADPAAARLALTMALDAARRAESVGKEDSRGALLALRDVSHWLESRPGRKNLILVSPGFIVPLDLMQNEGDVIEKAIQAQTSISTLDARGLATLFPSADTAYGGGSRGKIMERSALTREEATASSGVLRELAEATGGGYVRGTNDLYGGLQRLATPPEFTYLLGFKPHGLKMDGTFHALKVKMKKGEKLTPQARRGYYAPKK
jgi:VWFA-related protein